MQWYLKRSKEWYKGLSALDLQDTHAKTEQRHLKKIASSALTSPNAVFLLFSDLKPQHMIK